MDSLGEKDCRMPTRRTSLRMYSRRSLSKCDSGSTALNEARFAAGCLRSPAIGSKNWLASAARRTDATGGDDNLSAMQSQPEPGPESADWDADYARHVFHWAAAIVRQQVSEQTWQAFRNHGGRRPTADRMRRSTLGMTTRCRVSRPQPRDEPAKRTWFRGLGMNSRRRNLCLASGATSVAR
jgi:hypothetical protein